MSSGTGLALRPSRSVSARYSLHPDLTGKDVLRSLSPVRHLIFCLTCLTVVLQSARQVLDSCKIPVRRFLVFKKSHYFTVRFEENFFRATIAPCRKFFPLADRKNISECNDFPLRG